MPRVKPGQSAGWRAPCRREFSSPSLLIPAALALTALLVGCGGEVREAQPDAPAMEGFDRIEDHYVVDCLLPGEVRQMGRRTYLSPRRAVKTTVFDCRTRGGEYVAYSRADYRSALDVWGRRAAAGDAEAQVIVGEIHEKGLGLAPDYAKAAEWYRKAAAQGSERARLNLAYLYEQGLGVEQDMARAINLYRKASGDSDDELMFASAAREKIEALRTELERELDEARAQQRALQRQIQELRDRLEQQQTRNQEDQQTITALENLLAETNIRLQEKSRRLRNLDSMELGDAEQESALTMRGEGSAGPINVDGFKFGTYYALVIGLEDYQFWDDLASPHDDVNRIAGLLSSKYGFDTTVMLDANAREILSALNDLREKVDEHDNVLIYFAGHGQLKQPVADSLVGYWLAVDAQRERTTFWLPNSQINEQIALLPARSVMIVADSCYAGAMSSDPASLLMGGNAPLDDRRVEMGLQRTARHILSSGGLHPVLDRGEGRHSLFANAMISVLQENKGLLHEQALIEQLAKRVAQRAEAIGFEQRPELRPIRAAGHVPGGKFFMVPRQMRKLSRADFGVEWLSQRPTAVGSR